MTTTARHLHPPLLTTWAYQDPGDWRPGPDDLETRLAHLRNTIAKLDRADPDGNHYAHACDALDTIDYYAENLTTEAPHHDDMPPAA